MKAVKITQDHTKRVFAAIAKLPAKEVLVGYPQEGDRQPGIGSNKRTPDPGDPPTDMTNATIAYIMENGAPEVNIPARPSLVPGVEAAKNKLVGYWKQAAQAALKGDQAKVDRILHAIGLTAQASVRIYITNGNFQPLAPRTLSARLSRGRTGTKPLLDTGQMRNAVNYVIRTKLVSRWA